MPTQKLSREQWATHARAWKRSGLACQDYAAREGLVASTLSWWAWKLRSLGHEVPRSSTKPSLKPVVQAARFVEVLPDPANPPIIKIACGNAMVHVEPDFDAEHLRRVLDVMEARR